MNNAVKQISNTDSLNWRVPGAGLEPARPQWPQDFKSCVSTIPPPGLKMKGSPLFEDPVRADDQVRTGDLNLGKVALYQLSYIRILEK